MNTLEMVDHSIARSAPYIFTKRGTFYFSRRAPSHLLGHYKRDRIIISLRARPLKAAPIRAGAFATRLDQDWLTLRWKHDEQTFSRFMVDASAPSIINGSAPTFTEARDVYCKTKGKGRAKTFHQAIDRAGYRLTGLSVTGHFYPKQSSE